MGKPQDIETAVADEVDDQEIGPGWGRYLKRLREARSLTVDDVAKETLLEPKMIVALEAEDCAALPTSSFVKGYIRNYARFLEIDAEPLMTSFSSVCGEDLPHFNTVLKTKEPSSNDQVPRYLTGVIVAVVVLSAVFWWWSKVLAPATVDNIASAGVAEKTVSATVETMMPEPEIVAEQPVAVEVSEPVSDTVETTEATVAEKPEEVEPAAVATDTLTMTFSEDCWTEIYDANGERLYLDLGRAGNSKTVSGVTPFKILLGNAAGATLEFNGEAFDHHQYIKRSGSARFSLGE